MKICIIICTYNRNKELFALLRQLDHLRSTYAGPNSYTIGVADSNPDNSDLINSQKHLNYDFLLKNPSEGFDENILNYYVKKSGDFDYTLSVSDDDFVNSLQLHPFDIIDICLKYKKSVVLFNHYDYIIDVDEKIKILNKHYKSGALMMGGRSLAGYFLRLLPRHVGILYSRDIITSNLLLLKRFTHTNHLYSVPFLLAALNDDVLFFDYPLFYFSVNNGKQGAWENPEQVFQGLIVFLVNIHTLVPKNDYDILKDGFIANYFGEKAWLRSELESRNLPLLRYENILKLIP